MYSQATEHPTARSGEAEIPMPEAVPFLASLSWFDREFRRLSPLEALQRYEAGWRHLGVLASPPEEELRYIRALARRFGSFLRV